MREELMTLAKLFRITAKQVHPAPHNSADQR